jgi:hypothetical protein
VEHALRLPKVKSKRKRPLGPDTKYFLIATCIDVLALVMNLGSYLIGQPLFIAFLNIWNVALFTYLARRDYREFKKRFDRDMNDY